ncbi:2OG-Fe(II) oxygenase family protein [Dactylosporangium sp. NPDC051541]|uniref:2OG-Fe(II) oxygenase family protein n=1 Tax=Dactylosporangium sp. NPDC051541 TaxID=3363977 RepID=UPI0037B6730B
MGLTETGQVLVVDMNEADAPRRFSTSLHHSGFAVVVGHGLPTGTIDELTAEWGAFFDSGVPERFRADADNPWGFHQRDGELLPDGVTRRDRKQFYHFGLTQPLPRGVSSAARELLEPASGVARRLLGWLDDEWPGGSLTDKPSSLSSWISPVESVLRLQRYMPYEQPPAAGSIRALAHADINLLTLLPAPEILGLQIQPVGGDWIDLEYEPGLIIVNIGEMLQQASNGYYPATQHRVVVRDPRDAMVPRWSLPMFFHPDDDVVLSPGVTASEFRTARVADYQRKGWGVSVGGGSRTDDEGPR